MSWKMLIMIYTYIWTLYVDYLNSCLANQNMLGFTIMYIVGCLNIICIVRISPTSRDAVNTSVRVWMCVCVCVFKMIKCEMYWDARSLISKGSDDIRVNHLRSIKRRMISDGVVRTSVHILSSFAAQLAYKKKKNIIFLVFDYRDSFLYENG